MRKNLLIIAFALAAALGASISRADALTLSPPTAEVQAKPGETAEIVAKVYNEGNSALTLQPTVMSFTSKNETGQPDFYDDKGGLGLQNWISVPQSISLAPDERKSVIVTVKVPKSADPGGHYASIFWGASASEANAGTGIEGRIAMLILVNVEGDANENLRIIEFVSRPSFLTHLPVDFVARFQNDGTVHEHPAGNIVIKNMFGRRAAILPFNIQPSTGNVLPKSIRRFDTSWIKEEIREGASEWSKEWNNFAFGYYTAELMAAYGPSGSVVSAKTSFVVFPWMISAVMAIILVIVIFILRALLRAYNGHIIRKYAQGKYRK